MATLDEVLNVGVPVILILVVLGFLWVKIAKPMGFGEWLGNVWEWMKGTGSKIEITKRKEIVYE